MQVEFGHQTSTPTQDNVRVFFFALDVDDAFFDESTQKFFAIAIRVRRNIVSVLFPR